MATEYRKILQKAYTSGAWPTAHILANREIGFEIDTGKYKIGDGTTQWMYLPYASVGNEGATITELNDKVSKVSGKGLSTNDYTTSEKTKLSGIETGAQKNQNAFNAINVNDLNTITADSATDTLTIKAGSNISISANTSTDTITISGNPVIDSLTSTSTTSALSAYQGKVLNDKIGDNKSLTYYYQTPSVSCVKNIETYVYDIPNWQDLHDSSGNLLYYFLADYTQVTSYWKQIGLIPIPLDTWTQIVYNSESFDSLYLNIKITSQGKVYFKFYNSTYDEGDSSSWNAHFIAVQGQTFIG